MSFIVVCTLCGDDLEDPGALIFSPPEPGDGRTTKDHVCLKCWEEKLWAVLHVGRRN